VASRLVEIVGMVVASAIGVPGMMALNVLIEIKSFYKMF